MKTSRIQEFKYLKENVDTTSGGTTLTFALEFDFSKVLTKENTKEPKSEIPNNKESIFSKTKNEILENFIIPSINNYIISELNKKATAVTLVTNSGKIAGVDPEISGRYKFYMNAVLDTNSIQMEIDSSKNTCKVVFNVIVNTTKKAKLTRDTVSNVAKAVGRVANGFSNSNNAYSILGKAT